MTWDPVWDSIFRERPWGRYPAEDLVRFVARNFYRVKERRAVKILELGCGPGGNLWYFAREGFGTYGIDGAPTAVRLARERLDAEIKGWSGDIVVGDFCTLPFADASFAAVIDNEAVYCNHLEESKAIYREAHRVLSPGGKLFVRTFAAGSAGDGVGRKVGHNAWMVDEGTLAGTGMARFTTQAELPELLGPFRIDEVTLLTRAPAGAEDQCVREWLVTASRDAADGLR